MTAVLAGIDRVGELIMAANARCDVRRLIRCASAGPVAMRVMTVGAFDLRSAGTGGHVERLTRIARDAPVGKVGSRCRMTLRTDARDDGLVIPATAQIRCVAMQREIVAGRHEVNWVIATIGMITAAEVAALAANSNGDQLVGGQQVALRDRRVGEHRTLRAHEVKILFQAVADRPRGRTYGANFKGIGVVTPRATGRPRCGVRLIWRHRERSVGVVFGAVPRVEVRLWQPTMRAG